MAPSASLHSPAHHSDPCAIPPAPQPALASLPHRHQHLPFTQLEAPHLPALAAPHLPALAAAPHLPALAADTCPPVQQASAHSAAVGWAALPLDCLALIAERAPHATAAHIRLTCTAWSRCHVVHKRAAYRAAAYRAPVEPATTAADVGAVGSFSIPYDREVLQSGAGKNHLGHFSSNSSCSVVTIPLSDPASTSQLPGPDAAHPSTSPRNFGRVGVLGPERPAGSSASEGSSLGLLGLSSHSLQAWHSSGQTCCPLLDCATSSPCAARQDPSNAHFEPQATSLQSQHTDWQAAGSLNKNSPPSHPPPSQGSEEIPATEAATTAATAAAGGGGEVQAASQTAQRGVSEGVGSWRELPPPPTMGGLMALQRHMRCIVLEGCVLRSGDVAPLAGCVTLRSLSLARCVILDRALEELTDVLRLQHLSLAFALLQHPETIAHIGTRLIARHPRSASANSHLRLRLQWSATGLQGTAAGACLQELDLSGSACSAQVLEAAISAHPHLEALTLAACSHVSAATLRAVSRLEHLRFLDLSDIAFLDAAAVTLDASLEAAAVTRNASLDAAAVTLGVSLDAAAVALGVSVATSTTSTGTLAAAVATDVYTAAATAAATVRGSVPVTTAPAAAAAAAALPCSPTFSHVGPTSGSSTFSHVGPTSGSSITDSNIISISDEGTRRLEAAAAHNPEHASLHDLAATIEALSQHALVRVDHAANNADTHSAATTPRTNGFTNNNNNPAAAGVLGLQAAQGWGIDAQGWGMGAQGNPPHQMHADAAVHRQPAPVLAVAMDAPLLSPRSRAARAAFARRVTSVADIAGQPENRAVDATGPDHAGVASGSTSGAGRDAASNASGSQAARNGQALFSREDGSCRGGWGDCGVDGGVCGGERWVDGNMDTAAWRFSKAPLHLVLDQGVVMAGSAPVHYQVDLTVGPTTLGGSWLLIPGRALTISGERNPSCADWGDFSWAVSSGNPGGTSFAMVSPTALEAALGPQSALRPLSHLELRNLQVCHAAARVLLDRAGLTSLVVRPAVRDGPRGRPTFQQQQQQQSQALASVPHSAPPTDVQTAQGWLEAAEGSDGARQRVGAMPCQFACPVVPAVWRMLLNAFRMRGADLKSLVVQGQSGVNDAVVRRLRLWAPNLEHLDISGCDHVTGDGHAIARTLQLAHLAI